MTRLHLGISLLALTCAAPALAQDMDQARIELGPRPAYLISTMDESPLKDALEACAAMEPVRTDFSIAHRGAPLMFPEHTEQANRAGFLMGAGIMECDVAFTKDKELVCRHAQNDLHTTTNILATDLGAQCTTPFTPASGDTSAQVECRTSDITLAEYKTLNGKMDAGNSSATTVEQYMDATASFRTDLYATTGTLLSHKDSIALFKSLGAKFTPELKSPSVEMPFDGFTQEDYAQKLINEYKDAGIPASDVFAQSFDLNDVLYWIKAEPEFGANAVFLVEATDGFDPQDANTWKEDFTALKAAGVNNLAPSINMLVVNDGDKIVASNYAKAAKEAGLDLISWSLERSGPLATGGGWYFQSVTEAMNNDGDYFEVLDALAMDAGVKGVFSDWPATVTYYASCMGLK
ncbi:glycerophosphodiester phosphodiesterase family protein [Pacificibacter marinus]|uniref:glycerophosphodiester phosphodiesterase family protein n=1 Tax=Pacificibacter marinus TaxID=658057 RepID=UPI001C070D68|nr:glycerophosphodiester phosphodiesterase family protein [Pacificibacter marinus]MBU2868982.1 glycerophosphodiester phosphodiesterase [Pacificibacter marinus]